MITRADFQKLYDEGPDAVFTFIERLSSEFDRKLAEVQAQVKELQDRLGKDSHNSNKPPSSDGLAKKPAPVSLRKKSGRKPGGQHGHPGRCLAWSEQPDNVIVHSPAVCSGCGATLEAAKPKLLERRQVFDIPPMKLLVTEHQVMTKVCPGCGVASYGAFPKEAPECLQYGPGVRAMAVYLLDNHLLPYQRVAQLFADLFGAALCVGTLANIRKRASEALKAPLAAIKEALIAAPVIHCDETGLRVEGMLGWVHSVSTLAYTLYGVHRNRGAAGIEATGVLPLYLGTAIHDGWRPYRPFCCRHGLCNQHHIRELTAVHEQTGQVWAKAMIDLFYEIKETVECAKARGRPSLPSLVQMAFEARYRKLITEGMAANPTVQPAAGSRRRPKQSAARNLLDRLHNDMAAVLLFMVDFSVPFTNNQAERDIRMVKLRQKVSGCFRSEAGAQDFCRVRSYISTMRKQGQSVISALRSLFLGNPIMPALAE